MISQFDEIERTVDGSKLAVEGGDAAVQEPAQAGPRLAEAGATLESRAQQARSGFW
jgi:hypothetical protein